MRTGITRTIYEISIPHHLFKPLSDLQDAVYFANLLPIQGAGLCLRFTMAEWSRRSASSTDRRKQILRSVVPRRKESCLLNAQRAFGHGIELFWEICKRNLEGIVAKHRDGFYSRSTRWIKIRNPNYTQINGRCELFESRDARFDRIARFVNRADRHRLVW